MVSEIRRDDRYILPLPPDPPPMLVRIVRVAADNRTADIEVSWLGMSWRKRTPLPLPPGIVRHAWTDAERDDQAPSDSFDEFLADSSDEFDDSSDELPDSSDESRNSAEEPR